MSTHVPAFMALMQTMTDRLLGVRDHPAANAFALAREMRYDHAHSSLAKVRGLRRRRQLWYAVRQALSLLMRTSVGQPDPPETYARGGFKSGSGAAANTQISPKGGKISR